MPNIYHIIVFLCLIFIANESKQEKAGDEVNLILPRFINAKLSGNETTCIDDQYCNLTLVTRAGLYYVGRYDLKTGAYSSLTKLFRNDSTPQWKDPHVNEDNLFELWNLQIRMRYQALYDFSKSQPWKNPFETLDPYARYLCQAYTPHPKAEKRGTRDAQVINLKERVYKCFRDATVYVGDSKYSITSNITSDFAADVNAALMIPAKDKKTILMMFDGVGRVLVQYMDIQRKPTSTYLHTLSVIPHPLDDQSRTSSTDYISADMRSKITASLSKTHWGAYIEAITPLYPAQNGTGNSTSNQLGLWIVNGQSRSLDKQVRAYWKGEDQSNFVPKFVSSNPSSATSKASINALHMSYSSAKKTTYLHYAYTYVNETSAAPQVVYAFCTLNGTYESNVKTDTSWILGSVPKANSTTLGSAGCVSNQVELAPNDIFGYDDGDQCQRTIALFDFRYIATEIHKPVYAKEQTDKDWKWLSEPLHFFLKAAFIHNKKIYMFAYSNVLMVADVSMELCSDLKIGKAVEQTSQEYILYNAYQKSGESNEVSLYSLTSGYTEFVKGANDTKPSMMTSSSTDSTKSGGSNLLLIVALVIFGALIIACILYMCCLRDSSETAEPTRRSRKSRLTVAAQSPIKSLKSSKHLHQQTSAVNTSAIKQPLSAVSSISPAPTVRSAPFSSPSSQTSGSQTTPASGTSSSLKTKSKSPKSASPKLQPIGSKSPKSKLQPIGSKSPKSKTVSLKSPMMKSTGSKSPMKSHHSNSPKSKSKVSKSPKSSGPTSSVRKSPTTKAS